MILRWLERGREGLIALIEIFPHIFSRSITLSEEFSFQAVVTCGFSFLSIH